MVDKQVHVGCNMKVIRNRKALKNTDCSILTASLHSKERKMPMCSDIIFRINMFQDVWRGGLGNISDSKKCHNGHHYEGET